MLKPEDLAGNTIGKYKIERKIGEGGMAHVYLAQDTALSRPVAIKVLDTDRAANRRFVARFEREARIAGQLKHPNIVTVFDVVKTQGLFFIVMEYLEGEGLDVVLQKARNEGESLDPGFTIAVIRQVAEALDYAYQAGKVVHRDVKPANILILPNNQVKLTDFGIARALEEDSDLTTDAYIGTPFYMSPEHFTGGQIDHRSDIYSLGVVLYQMMVNVVGPFGDTDTSLTALSYNHAHVKPLPPRKLNPDIKPQVEKVILKALEKEPNHRYQTGTDLVQALTGAYTKSTSTLPRWLVPAVSGLAFVLLLLLGLVFYLFMNGQSTPSIAAAETPSPTVASQQTMVVSVINNTILRGGPGHEYDELGALERGISLTLEAIDPDDKWAKVTASDSTAGWLPITNLNLEQIDIAAVPVAIIIPPTPTPAPTGSTIASAEPTVSDAPAIAVQVTNTVSSSVEQTEQEEAVAMATSTATTASQTQTPTRKATATSTPTAANVAAQPIAKPAQPARVIYVQSNGEGHYLGVVSSGGDLLNGGLHEFAAAPAWSPNGVQVAFFGKQGISQLGGDYSIGSGLWVLDANAPDQNPAWRLKADDHMKNIAWSPDGTKIAYETEPPGVSSNIVVVDARDGAEISRYPGAHPVWMPDSQKLVIKTCAPECGLWLVNFDGSGASQQTFDASDSYPSVSPTGQIAFCSSRDNNWEIYTVNSTGGELTRVTNRPSTDITPVFSPDGREIYLRTDHYGGWRITAIGPDGSNERTVKEGVGESFDWGLARPAVN